jgi:hypothetical protein
MARKTYLDTNQPRGETGAKKRLFFHTFGFGVFLLKQTGCYNSLVGCPCLYQPAVSVLPELDLCEHEDAAQNQNFKVLGVFNHGGSAAF